MKVLLGGEGANNATITFRANAYALEVARSREWQSFGPIVPAEIITELARAFVMGWAAAVEDAGKPKRTVRRK